jgi:hypothetical protein
VKAIKVDLKKNLLRIDYVPEKITPEKMVEMVGKQEHEGTNFEGTIIPPDR